MANFEKITGQIIERIDAMADRVDNMERALNEITEHVDGGGAAAAGAAGPAATPSGAGGGSAIAQLAVAANVHAHAPPPSIHESLPTVAQSPKK